MKQTRFAFFVAVMTLAFALPALAAQTKPEPGASKPGRAAPSSVMNLTPEQRKQADELFAAHQEKIMPLREKLDARLMELESYRGLSGVSKEDVRALTEEIATLRGQLRTEGAALFSALEKAGLAGPGGCFGGHRGMMGWHGSSGCPWLDGDGGCPWPGHGSGMMGRGPGGPGMRGVGPCGPGMGPGGPGMGRGMGHGMGPGGPGR